MIVFDRRVNTPGDSFITTCAKGTKRGADFGVRRAPADG
jgi:hypothetical protein